MAVKSTCNATLFACSSETHQTPPKRHPKQNRHHARRNKRPNPIDRPIRRNQYRTHLPPIGFCDDCIIQHGGLDESCKIPLERLQIKNSAKNVYHDWVIDESVTENGDDLG